MVGRAHGVHGELTVQLRTDEPERRFATGTRLRSEQTGRPFTVTGQRRHQGRLLVRFDQIADRTAAEAVRGTVLVTDVPAAEEPAESEEFYDRQLIGLSVVSAAGQPVGSVRSVLHLPAQDLLEVATDGGVRLIPFVAGLVPVVDLAAARLVLADVPGLIDDAGLIDDGDEPDAGQDPGPA